ncbi:MAG: hypothetical protein ACK56F_23525, partial [bacterium]
MGQPLPRKSGAGLDEREALPTKDCGKATDERKRLVGEGECGGARDPVSHPPSPLTLARGQSQDLPADGMGLQRQIQG